MIWPPISIGIHPFSGVKPLYLPLATCLIVSIIGTLLFFLFRNR
ncbi:MAG: DUF2905 family protein [Deltaproteobacteria bacterium]|nr:DUF2905 family protein [Deltaproteobacteria bacterium]MBN2846545.1 DUF2905 family protein [Deltaproteobacteria bacterium]